MTIFNFATSHADFTFVSAVKYKLGGPGDSVDVDFKVHVAILRCFALDNPKLRKIVECEDTGDEDGDDSEGSVVVTTDGLKEEPPQKKRKTKGHTPKAQDFWSRVDLYFADLIKVKGAYNLSIPAWRSFADDIVRRDERMFPHGSDLSSLPTITSTSPSDDRPILTKPTYTTHMGSNKLGSSESSADSRDTPSPPRPGGDLLRLLNHSPL
ncbi:hypothetical protein C8Q78DRAFT_1076023 [Trametes maxima]|nr:hypothetical protein C8Q78DRAFT_1076023 [Trametes maxima]